MSQENKTLELDLTKLQDDESENTEQSAENTQDDSNNTQEDVEDMNDERNEQEKRFDNLFKNMNKMKKNEWKEFGESIGYNLVNILVLFVIGSRIVFAGKIAQFNILPTDINCMPYKAPKGGDISKSPTFQDEKPEASIDILRMREGENMVTYATKIIYDTSLNRKDRILDSIRKIEYDPEVGTFIKYMMVCITKLFVFFYGISTFVYRLMNQYMYEFLVLLLGPHIIGYLLISFIPISFIASIVICLINMKWLWYRNMNTDPDYKYKNDKEPVWRSIDMFSDIINFGGTMLYLLLGIWFSFTLCFTPIPLLIGIFCLLVPLFMSATISSGSRAGKTYGIYSSIKGLIETKMVLFMAVFAYYTVSNAFEFLSWPIATAITFASLIFIFTAYTSKQSVPSSASKGLTSFKVNMKLCPTEKMTQQELLELERDAKDLTARPPQDLMQKFNEYKSKASQVQGVAQKMQQMKNLQKGGSDILEKKLDKLRETLGK